MTSQKKVKNKNYSIDPSLYSVSITPIKGHTFREGIEDIKVTIDFFCFVFHHVSRVVIFLWKLKEGGEYLILLK